MDQTVIAERVEHLVRDLRQIPPSQRQQAGYSDRLENLVELVFEQGGLSALGHLLTLDAFEQILQENEFDQGPYSGWMLQLQEHRRRMAHAHAQLAAILSPQISIQDLLYDTLDDWLQLSQPIGPDFPPDLVQELQLLRVSEDDRPSERLRKFCMRYFEVLVASGSEASFKTIKTAIDTTLTAYAMEEQQATVHALFAERAGHQGYCYRVRIAVEPGNGQIYTDSDVNEAMKKAARTAAQYVLAHNSYSIERHHVRWSIQEPFSYEGQSIGLAIALGVLANLHTHPIDGYTAFTGTVSDEGHVGRVESLGEKLEAARKAGFQRVLLPKENLEEATSWATDTFMPIGVDSVEEAWSLLNAPRAALHPTPTRKGLIRHFCYDCQRIGIQVSQEEYPQFLRLRITDDYTSEVILDIYDGKGGMKTKIGGPQDTPLARKVKPIVDAIFGTGSTPPSQQKAHKIVLRDPAMRSKVATALRGVAPYDEQKETHCEYRYDFFERGERVIVRQFTNGTLTIQQTKVGSADDPLFSDLCRQVQLVTKALPQDGGSPPDSEERERLASSGASTRAASLFKTPWIGTDESGKGDYFGPLVSAAVYVDDHLLEQLVTLGVKDSKLLSDKKARDLAEGIRTICAERFSEVVITPEHYNRLYEDFQREGKTLNHLLAWGHYRVLENLLAVVDCDNIIVDQFANEYYLRSRLLNRKREGKLNLVQMPRAEANPAVAAASILARDLFLTWLETKSRKYGPLPKGASPAVVQTARAIVSRFGKEELRMIAKLHFKTTEQVMAPA